MTASDLVLSATIGAGSFLVYRGLKDWKSNQGKIQVALGALAVVGGIYALVNSYTEETLSEIHGAARQKCKNFLQEEYSNRWGNTLVKPALNVERHISISAGGGFSRFSPRRTECIVDLTVEGARHLRDCPQTQ
ncbi:MAG: hypothetical protein JSS30_01690, partial [Verrucomicrobia bacterium]|nr:hypothetical protein [Verrucomicrobiota bacterium]